jgi:hypothetical protein
VFYLQEGLQNNIQDENEHSILMDIDFNVAQDPGSDPPTIELEDGLNISMCHVSIIHILVLTHLHEIKMQYLLQISQSSNNLNPKTELCQMALQEKHVFVLFTTLQAIYETKLLHCLNIDLAFPSFTSPEIIWNLLDDDGPQA